MRVRVVLSMAVLLGVAVSVAHARDFAVVSNQTSGVKAITAAQLTAIAKGTLAHWPDGKPITLVLRVPASPEMKPIVQKLYAMPTSEVNSLIFEANRARPDSPAFILVNSDEAVLKRVESTPGAVGLVDVYSITGGIRVVRVAGKLPLEPGYLLHSN
jgi:ABC-type phosphate transport system substrate-binding protein